MRAFTGRLPASATRVVNLARDRGEELTQRDAIVQTAQNRAKNIIAQARREAETIRTDADVYVLDVLKELEDQLMQNMGVVRNGIAKLAEERESSRARMQTVYDEAESEVAAVTQELVEATVPAQSAPATIEGSDDA
jgi:NH3-dependent NAD+ synthetase